MPLVDVFLTVGVRTSAGPDHGHKRLAPGGIAALVADRRAVYGEHPPVGVGDPLVHSLSHLSIVPAGPAPSPPP